MNQHAFSLSDKNMGSSLIDGFGRPINYLRLSVTDRCDLRCSYCMAENMVFLPKRELLTLEELYRLSSRLIKMGIRKIRLTGGEPLVRRDIMTLFELIGQHLGNDLDELTLTTNGTMLSRYAKDLARCGVKRLNVSLDTLDAKRYHEITRRGDIAHVLSGIDAALEADLKVKINTVAMRGAFLDEVDDLIHFCHSRNMHLTLIEEMPLGNTGHNRYDTHLSLSALRDTLAKRWTLTPAQLSTGGPARYMHVEETGGIIGFITPLSCDFCSNCNRIRIGSTGRLYTCMGHNGMIELRETLRNNESDDALVEKICEAIRTKPKGHDFIIGKNQTHGPNRHMSELGG